MKASVLSLLVATAAFGASSIYLWSQLQNERARADEITAESAALNARIAELETARTQFEQRRFASANTFGGSSAMVGPGRPPPAAEIPAAGKSETRTELSPWSVRPSPERTDAMQRMMRAQLRANNKRLYIDVGSELGLTKEQANKLIDLRTEQQTMPFINRPAVDPADGHNVWAETQHKVDTDIADLIGPEKAALLREYEKSIPDRQELDMVARQLEGYDAPLNEYQRKQMLTAMADERERVPAPEYGESTNMEEFQKARTTWENDFNERVASQARTILSSDQLTAYNDYQQAQKDMRAQFATMIPNGARRVLRGGIAGGNVTFTSAAPVTEDFVGEVPESPAPAKK